MRAVLSLADPVACTAAAAVLRAIDTVFSSESVANSEHTAHARSAVSRACYTVLADAGVTGSIVVAEGLSVRTRRIDRRRRVRRRGCVGRQGRIRRRGRRVGLGPRVGRAGNGVDLHSAVGWERGVEHRYGRVGRRRRRVGHRDRRVGHGCVDRGRQIRVDRDGAVGRLDRALVVRVAIAEVIAHRAGEARRTLPIHAAELAVVDLGREASGEKDQRR